MPDSAHFYDQIVRFVSAGAVGLGIGAALLVALRALLPARDRKKLRVPAAVLALHAALLLARLPFDPNASTGRTLSIASLFLLLLALGRSAFLLVVDVVIGVRLGRPLPRIIHDIIQGVVYAFVVIVTLRAAGVEAGSLLTTSALLTAVIGLSLQDTLGNLFAGLSLQAQRPFEVGDWIQLESDQKQVGRVVEINWRATTVVTSDQVEVIIPNGALAKAQIRNFNKPTTVVRRTIEVQGPYDASPRQVEEALLAAVSGAPGVLVAPPPFVLMNRFADSGISYNLCFFIDDYTLRDRVESLVRQRIWFAFKRAGLSIPFATHTVHMADATAEAHARADEGARAARRRALMSVDFIAGLPEPTIARLAALSSTYAYMAGETVIRQGDPGNALFVVQSGSLSVLVGRDGGSTAELARLGPGKFFGEMSLMTGEPRTATIQAITDCELVRVDKAAFQEILAASPSLAEQITQVLIERQAAIDENLSARRARAAGTDEERRALLSRIRLFFAI